MTFSLRKLCNFSGRKFLPLFLFVFVILSLTFVSAAPPVTEIQQFSEGYEIRSPRTVDLKQYQDYEFEFHVHNISNGVAVTDKVICYFHLYNSSGMHQWEDTDATVSHDFDYSFFVDGGNFSELGEGYWYNIYCETPFPKTGTVYWGGHDAELLNITPIGYEGKSLPLFLILMISAAILFALAYILNSDWLIFLSAIVWILSGMYGLIYGIGNLANLYTRAISVIIMVIGMVFIVSSIYNLARDND